MGRGLGDADSAGGGGASGSTRSEYASLGKPGDAGHVRTIAVIIVNVEHDSGSDGAGLTCAGENTESALGPAIDRPGVGRRKSQF